MGSKATRTLILKRLAVVLFLFCFSRTVAQTWAGSAKTEYIYLTSRGNDMAPAICDGDTAKVKICANGTLIQVGPENSTHPGDIIVYCAAVAGAVSESMFACGRAVYKWFKDGEWWFKTQMDSSAEPDKWWVPEHALLGVVVEVIRGVSSGRETNAGASGLPGPVNDLITGTAIGVVVGALGAIGNSHSREDTQYLIPEGSEPDDRISPLQLGFSSLHQLVKREDGRNWNQRV